MAFCGFLLWVVIYVHGTAVLSHTAWEELPVLGSAFLFGMLLETTRRWAWSLILVPILVVTVWNEVVFGPFADALRSFLRSVPWALVGPLGAAWTSVATGLSRLQGRTRDLLLTVNGLNVADALLTAFAVHHAQAVEANPVIRAVGLPAKVAAVAILSLVLARRAPRALVWPVLVLLGTVAWHLGGLYLNAHV